MIWRSNHKTNYTRILLKDISYDEAIAKAVGQKGSAGLGLWQDGESVYMRVRKTNGAMPWRELRDGEAPGKLLWVLQRVLKSRTSGKSKALETFNWCQGHSGGLMQQQKKRSTANMVAMRQQRGFLLPPAPPGNADDFFCCVKALQNAFFRSHTFRVKG